MENPNHKWRVRSLGKSSISKGHLYHGYCPWLPWLSGWWIETCFIFHHRWDHPSICLISHVLVGGLEPWNFMTVHSVGNVIIPTDELIFFRGVVLPPTSYVNMVFPASWIDCPHLFPSASFRRSSEATLCLEPKAVQLEVQLDGFNWDIAFCGWMW